LNSVDSVSDTSMTQMSYGGWITTIILWWPQKVTKLMVAVNHKRFRVLTAVLLKVQVLWLC